MGGMARESRSLCCETRCLLRERFRRLRRVRIRRSASHSGWLARETPVERDVLTDGDLPHGLVSTRTPALGATDHPWTPGSASWNNGEESSAPRSRPNDLLSRRGSSNGLHSTRVRMRWVIVFELEKTLVSDGRLPSRIVPIDWCTPGVRSMNTPWRNRRSVGEEWACVEAPGRHSHAETARNRMRQSNRNMKICS